jgi:hypothetical protein
MARRRKLLLRRDDQQVGDDLQGLAVGADEAGHGGDGILERGRGQVVALEQVGLRRARRLVHVLRVVGVEEGLAIVAEEVLGRLQGVGHQLVGPDLGLLGQLLDYRAVDADEVVLEVDALDRDGVLEEPVLGCSGGGRRCC